MRRGLAINAREERGFMVVGLAGEFDLSVKVIFDTALKRAISPDLPSLIIDLSELEFLDSSGIHSLVMAHRGCATSGQRLVVVRSVEAVMKVLELCGLNERLTVVDRLDDAFRRLDGSDFAAA